MSERVLIVSPHGPSRALLGHVLASPGRWVEAVADGDAAFDAVQRTRPALVVVDLRRPDEDGPLFLALLRRRYPRLAVIALLPGCVRVLSGAEESVEHVHAVHPDDLGPLLHALHTAVRDVLAERLLTLLRPTPGSA